MKIKTQDLTDAALDWAVQEIEYQRMVAEGEHVKQWALDDHRAGASINHYSTDWLWGGAIIDREITKIFRNVGGTWSAMILKDVPIPPEDRGTSLALTRRAQWNGAGPTPLIAAMRCFCSKLGDVVDIPEELCQQQNS